MDTVDRKTRGLAVLGTAIFLFVAPGTVAGLVPWWIGRWSFHSSVFGFTALRWIGGLLMAAGMVTLLEAFLRFALNPHFSPSPCPRTFRCDQSTQRGRLPWRRVVGAADGRARGALRASSAGSGRILGAPVRPFTRRVGFGGCCGLSAGQQRKAAQARS